MCFINWHGISILAKIIPKNYIMKDLIKIDDVLVNKEIIERNFTCDLNKCKGACCTMESDYGAPLLEEEIAEITAVLPAVKKILSQEQIDEIDKNGFHFKIDGELMVKAIDNKECIFAYYDGDVAKCAIERAYYNGESKFIKPLSCHLFPIRINQFGGDVLKYEIYHECFGAVALGAITEIPVFEFCEGGLKRKYGNDWYDKLKTHKV